MSRRNSASDPVEPRTETSPAVESADRPAFELSLTQIVASAAAATTAALLGSRLGVAGTILGAAVASLISVVAGAVYSHSIAAARHRVKIALHKEAQLAAALGTPTAAMDLPPITAASPVPDGLPAPLTSPMPVVGTGGMQTTSGHGPTMANDVTRVVTSAPRRTGVRAMVLGAVATVAVFAVTLVLITGIETVKGTPLSGGNSGGLSVLGGDRGGVANADEPAVDDSSTDTAPGTAGSEAPPADDARTDAPVTPTTDASAGSRTPTTSPTPTTSDPATTPSTDQVTAPATDSPSSVPPTTVTSTVTQTQGTTAPPSSAGSSTEPTAPTTSDPTTSDPSTTPTTDPGTEGSAPTTTGDAGSATAGATGTD